MHGTGCTHQFDTVVKQKELVQELPGRAGPLCSSPQQLGTSAEARLSCKSCFGHLYELQSLASTPPGRLTSTAGITFPLLHVCQPHTGHEEVQAARGQEATAFLVN